MSVTELDSPVTAGCVCVGTLCGVGMTVLQQAEGICIDFLAMSPLKWLSRRHTGDHSPLHFCVHTGPLGFRHGDVRSKPWVPSINNNNGPLISGR